MNKLKYSVMCVVFSICTLVSGHAQQTQQKNPADQKKVTRINPVKVDTTDPNKKALMKFSQDKMFNVTEPPRQMTPEEIKAINFFNEGSRKGKEGDYAGAIQDFTTSLGFSKNVNTYAKRGYAYLMVGNFGAAISDETEALKLNHTYLHAYLLRGVARFEVADLPGAKLDLEVYLDQDRTNAMAFNYMAGILFLDKDFKGALEHYNEVVRLDPEYPDIYTNRGMMRHYNQDFLGAVKDYDKALELNPRNPSAFNNRGAAKMMLKDFPGALADFDKAIGLNEKYEDAYDNRGRVKHALGDLTGACADWNQAYTLGMKASMDLIVKYCK